MAHFNFVISQNAKWGHAGFYIDCLRMTSLLTCAWLISIQNMRTGKYSFTKKHWERVCVQARTAAVNVTLLAFAADRRAAARSAVAVGCRPCSNRSISPARRAHSSKRAARCCSGRYLEQTDGHRTVTQCILSTRFRPGGGEPICLPPTAVRSKNRGGSMSVRGLVRSPHTAGGRW